MMRTADREFEHLNIREFEQVRDISRIIFKFDFSSS
jgi:hypothetical protein